MSFLRRLFGGEPTTAPDVEDEPASVADLDQAERDYEREVLRGEAERLDELRQRQLRYADRAWTPPPQGGERRADDKDGAPDND